MCEFRIRTDFVSGAGVLFFGEVELLGTGMVIFTPNRIDHMFLLLRRVPPNDRVLLRVNFLYCFVCISSTIRRLSANLRHVLFDLLRLTCSGLLPENLDLSLYILRRILGCAGGCNPCRAYK